MLEKIERFIFLVFHLSSRQSNTKNNHFFRQATRLYKGIVTIKQITGDVGLLTDGTTGGKYVGYYELGRFKSQVKESLEREEGFYSWVGVKYFLFEYETHLREQAKGEEKITWYQFDSRKKEESIEHVYPQTPKDSCWKNAFDGYNRKERELYLHSLGNLLLLSKSKNSQLQNKCFDLKKKSEDKRAYK